MSADRDWEKTLRDDQYDLPDQTWQRMENDMRGWLAAQARAAQVQAHPKSASWWATWLKPSRWGVALAGFALAGVVVHFQSTEPDSLNWELGQAKAFDGSQPVAWESARCEIQGSKAQLTLTRMDPQTIQVRLDQGQATFHVQPRHAGETFQVDLAKDCQVQVVGTVFTVGMDSLKAWVSVEEGRVRLQAGGDGRFVDRGGRARCPEPESAPSIASLADSSVPAKDSVPAVPVAPVVAKPEIVVPSCNEPGPCVSTLSNFVRQHTEHPAVSEVALRWGRLATRGGDPRDALVGYSHVTSPVLRPLARLESMQLRAREFGEQVAVADSLDHWLSALKTSDPIWKPVAQLRVELYRRQGDDSGARRLQERISGAATAESRGR